MANWWDTIKDEWGKNTIENPLNDLFNIPKEKRVPVVKSPIKEKVKTDSTNVKDKITDTIQDTKDKITDIKTKVTPIIFFGGIALIIYMFSDKK